MIHAIDVWVEAVKLLNLILIIKKQNKTKSLDMIREEVDSADTEPQVVLQGFCVPMTWFSILSDNRYDKHTVLSFDGLY